MSSLPDEFPDSLPVSEARDQLAELLNRALYTGQITYVTKRGQRVGAIVPVHVAQAAEDAEAGLDAGGTTRPLSQVLADLELNPGPAAPAPREGDPPAVSSTGDAERRPRT